MSTTPRKVYPGTIQVLRTIQHTRHQCFNNCKQRARLRLEPSIAMHLHCYCQLVYACEQKNNRPIGLDAVPSHEIHPDILTPCPLPNSKPLQPNPTTFQIRELKTSPCTSHQGHRSQRSVRLSCPTNTEASSGTKRSKAGNTQRHNAKVNQSSMAQTRPSLPSSTI